MDSADQGRTGPGGQALTVASWNLAYMKPAHFKSIENRRRQWAFLSALAPDVALLQECRPRDLHAHAPAWMAGEYDILGEVPNRWMGCSAVLARKSPSLRALNRSELPEAEQRWLAYLAEKISTGLVDVAGREVSIASVHANAAQVDDPAVSDEDHEQVRRPALRRAWHNDLAAAALDPLSKSRFVIGGDWNNALLFDTTYPREAPASTEFFVNRSSAGWHHALRKFSKDEKRTYLEPSSEPYELDHIFTDSELHACLTGAQILAQHPVPALSDHAVLLAEFVVS